MSSSEASENSFCRRLPRWMGTVSKWKSYRSSCSAGLSFLHSNLGFCCRWFLPEYISVQIQAEALVTCVSSPEKRVFWYRFVRHGCCALVHCHRPDHLLQSISCKYFPEPRCNRTLHPISMQSDARRAHLIPVEGVKRKACNLCDRCTSGAPLTFEACECDKGAAVRLYVCRCFQSVACTIRNPFSLFLIFLSLLPTSSAPSKKNVSLFC